jgi:hypothetical protein
MPIMHNSIGVKNNGLHVVAIPIGPLCNLNFT